MAKHLTKNEVSIVIDAIDVWSEPKLTWNDICNTCEELIGRKPTRQSLNSNHQIKLAYTTKKETLKKGVVRQPVPSSLKAGADRIKRLESQIDRLKAENRLLSEKFTVWQYNAYTKGITEEMLNKPLPEIDRERTEE